jgi:DNA modification methylase
MWLMLGRCQDRFKDIPDASIDLFVIGLPYGSTEQDWDVIIPPAEFWAEVKRCRKPGAPICFLCNAQLMASLIESNQEEFKDFIVWAKPQAADPANKTRFRKACEYVVIFCDQKYKCWNPVESTGDRYTEHDDPTKPTGVSVSGTGMHSKHRECPPAHVAVDGSVHRLPVFKVACDRCGAVPGACCTSEKGKETTNAHSERIKTYLAGEVRCDVCDVDVTDDDIVGIRYPTNIRYFPQDNTPLEESKHDTPNPVTLAAYLIDCLSKPGDTVCDFTMGGGTTGVAAVNMGRYFVGMEMEYKFFYHAALRIQGTALGSNKEYEQARKLTNNFSQPRELLEDAERWEKRAKKHEKELYAWRELADKVVLAVLKANPAGLTTAQVQVFSGLGALAEKTLNRLEKAGIVVKTKGRPVIWTAVADQTLLASAAAVGD